MKDKKAREAIKTLAHLLEGKAIILPPEYRFIMDRLEGK